MSRSLALIVNPAAAGGRALAALPTVRGELDLLEAGYHVHSSSGLEGARAAARRAVEAGETVVAMGGDGLVGALAGVVSGTESALAIIPGGRGNDFARGLGIPEAPAAAARVALQGQRRLVDVGRVNGVVFVGIASLGIDSECQDIANSTKLVRGDLVYVYAVVRALVAWRPARFEVSIDGDRRAFRGYAVAAANSKVFGGGMYLAPDAELDDGELDVVLTGAATKRRYLLNLPKVFKGAHVHAPGLVIRRGRVVEIDADRPFTVYADGDPIATLPARVDVAQKALGVIVP